MIVRRTERRTVLAHAIVPLTARPPQKRKKGEKPEIDILKHSPHDTEKVPVGLRSEVENGYKVPDLKLKMNVNAATTGAEVSNWGGEKRRQEERPLLILLDPMLTKADGKPSYLEW
jgi:hypothetical protein